MAKQTDVERGKATIVRFAALAAFMLMTCTLASGCGKPPQLSSPGNLEAADALWTAVSAKQTNLLDSSASEIESLHSTQKMPDDVYASLSGVVATAREGDWAAARATLKTFIQGQRPAKPK